MLLFLGVPRRDTKPQAKGLILRFGSLAAAITAAPDDLAAAGAPPRVADAFEVVQDALHRLARADRMNRVHLGDWASLERLPRPGLARAAAARLQHAGPEQPQPAAVRASLAAGREPTCEEMLRRALALHASALVVVRNAGAARPRVEASDRALCERLTRLAEIVSVHVHDLMVVGDGDWISLRQAG